MPSSDAAALDIRAAIEAAGCEEAACPDVFRALARIGFRSTYGRAQQEGAQFAIEMIYKMDMMVWFGAVWRRIPPIL